MSLQLSTSYPGGPVGICSVAGSKCSLSCHCLVSFPSPLTVETQKTCQWAFDLSVTGTSPCQWVFLFWANKCSFALVLGRGRFFRTWDLTSQQILPLVSLTGLHWGVRSWSALVHSCLVPTGADQSSKDLNRVVPPYYTRPLHLPWGRTNFGPALPASETRSHQGSALRCQRR